MIGGFKRDGENGEGEVHMVIVVNIASGQLRGGATPDGDRAPSKKPVKELAHRRRIKLRLSLRLQTEGRSERGRWCRKVSPEGFTAFVRCS